MLESLKEKAAAENRYVVDRINEQGTPEPVINQIKPSKIAILLASFRGEKFISTQLDSLNSQSLTDWKVWISDDGSDDGTREILLKYASDWGDNRISITDGPKQGYVSNFLSLLCNPRISAEYFAFCDQDDVWQPEKLSHALKWLESVPETIPALYCSRTRLIDEAGNDIGFSPRYRRPPGFANALVQNIASGNTMVMNQAARSLLQKAGEDLKVVYHDWWAYILVSGAGGRVFYDKNPAVLYRQHSENMIGSTVNIVSRVFRVRLLLKGRFRDWGDLNTEALDSVRDILTPENRLVFESYKSARKQSFFNRIQGVYRSGVYRQTVLGNIGFLVATVLGKI